jgi:glutathione S-transferase
MIVVHHLANSRSQRVLWLLEELGVPYEVRRYERDPKTMLAPESLRVVHPLGKSPVMTDDTTGALQTVAETGAIIETLIERYGPNTPLQAPAVGSTEAAEHRYWMHFAEGSAMPPLLMKLVFDRIAQGPMPFFIRPIARGISTRVLDFLVWPNLRRHLDFMDTTLKSRPWFAGERFTAADVMMSFPVEASALRAGLDASRPHLWDWLQRIHARPAYQRALERGGRYDFGPRSR